LLQAILFDLDDTLIRTDTDAFLRRYFDSLEQYLSDICDGEMLQRWIGLSCQRIMASEHPEQTNLEAFCEEFTRLSGLERDEYWPRLRQFYSEVYPALKDDITPMPNARRAVLEAKARGLRLVIATNPLFPLEAVEARLRWGGIDDVEFDLLTALENMHYAKPQPQYYLEAAQAIGVEAEKCLAVGNDMVLDIIPAKRAGMWTYLVCEGDCEARSEVDAWGTLGSFVDMMREGTLPGQG